MVCDRCIMTINYQFSSIGIIPIDIQLGKVILNRVLKTSEIEKIELVLKQFGFEILKDNKHQLVECIKDAITYLLYYNGNMINENLSEFISIELNKEYSFLNSLFSEMEGITIEKYFFIQKIERIKELLTYDELSLSEIANKLGYKSASNLSNQFKKVTGLTPTYFKQIKENKRFSI
jgi:AraC-like DNA-binding protein